MIREYKNKTALITGGASGIGFALAEQAGREGMHIVIADIEQDALTTAEQKLKEQGCEVLAVQCDVSKSTDMQNLLQRSLERFGAVHLLCNNAGVSGGNLSWETSLEEWEWVLGANLWGVIHGVRLFLPEMMKQEQAHIVNTASIAGLMSVPGMGPYNVSKHGVVTLSETLCSELRNIDSPLGVSVLCPSFVQTRIHLSDRNRNDIEGTERRQRLHQAEETFKDFFAQAMPGAAVAKLVFDAVRNNRFYVFTHKDSEKKVEQRMRTIIDGRNPEISGPEEFPLEALET